MFGAAVEAAFRHDAIRSFPRECGGFVVGGQYVPVENISGRDDHFEFRRESWIEHGKIEAVLHSHCSMSRAPSAADMRSQIDTDVPWGITLTDGHSCSGVLWWGDFILDENLIGRKYLWGVRDCWSLIRAFFWQTKKVRLIDIPRDEKQFLSGIDMMRANASRAGFRNVPEKEAQAGDMVFMTIRGNVPNHCAMLLDGGLILHHLPNRLSYRQPLGNWRRLIADYLRYEP